MMLTWGWSDHVLPFPNNSLEFHLTSRLDPGHFWQLHGDLGIHEQIPQVPPSRQHQHPIALFRQLCWGWLVVAVSCQNG